MRAQHRFASFCFAIAATVCTGAHADVGLTLKRLTWDPRQPDSTPYQDTMLDPVIAGVINQGWSDARDSVTKSIVAEITKSERFGKGITLYNVNFRLPTANPKVTVAPVGPVAGRMRLTLSAAEMDFRATHPLTSRNTDVHMRVTFDLAVDVFFALNGDHHPPIDILDAKAQPLGANVTPINVSAAVALIASDIVTALTHDNALDTVITQGVNKSAVDVTRLMTSSLRTKGQQLDIPTGYKYNGGRVDPDRIIIAAWQAKSLPTANISVQATWDGKYGRLLPNCDPLGLRVTMPYAPPPFGQAKHIDSDNYPSGPSGSVQVGKDYGCGQTIAGVQGVAGTLLYKENVVDASHPREPGYDRTVRAVPVNWTNPLLVGDATRGKAQFRLDVRDGIHDGSQQRDHFQEMVRGNPGDPIERSNPAINPATRAATTTNPAERVDASQSAQRALSAFRSPSVGVNSALNPQPLPPGPPGPPDRGNPPAKAPAPVSSLGARSSSEAGVVPPSGLGK